MTNSVTKTTKTKLKRPEQHYDLYEVWWDDAAGLRHGWMDRTEKPKAQMVISVGFLIADEPDHIIIAQDTDDNGAHNGRTQIPRGMVKRLRLIRRKDKVEKKDENHEQAPVGPVQAGVGTNLPTVETF